MMFRRKHAAALAIKHAVDRVVAAVALVVAAPIFALVAIGVRTALGTPVLFVQERAGLHGRPFRLMKFRTMLPDSVMPGGVPMPEAQRLTRVGRWLRQSSADELPQLWNVLRGDMSLVGPRPLPTFYLERYSPEQQRRHQVEPGMTGWAQINGRNAVSWEERLELDVWYVDHWSLGLDARIVILTLGYVFRARDTRPLEGEIMEEFRGRT
jgi:lipopolysaccharide/colanic/teichoic acid biosynthesis glycosyltransferase